MARAIGQRFVKGNNFDLKARGYSATAKNVQTNATRSVQLLPFDKSSSDLVGRYCAHTLRFSVHNTYSYKVGFLLSFMKENNSVNDYLKTKVCKDVFGEVSLDFLKAVYHHRMPLTSYFWHSRSLPNIGQNIVNICMACGTKRGNCVCPLLDTSFYLFCRKPCLKEKFDCTKCKK